MNKENLAIVLHVITRLDPGGSAENTVLSVERVDPNRFDSRILTGPGLDGSGPPQNYLDRIGCRLEIEESLVRPIQPFNDLKALRLLAGHIRRVRPDILHLHSAKAGALGRVAAKLARSRAKIIYTPHGHVFSGYGGSTSSRIFTIIEKYLVAWSDAIVGLTRDEIRAFQKVGAGHPHIFCVIPSGVELQDFYRTPEGREKARKELGLADDANVVGFVGRLDDIKGPDLFIEVAAEVLQLLSNVRFVIVGDGEMRSSLESRADELGIADAILWLGWRSDTNALYPALDVFTLTSRNEGQGRVLVEAMAAELPQVAMVSGGVVEVVKDGQTGILVPNGDISAAAEAIVELLQNPEKRLEMGRAGRQQAEELFSVSVMIERLEWLYGGLLDGKTPEKIFGKAS